MYYWYCNTFLLCTFFLLYLRRQRRKKVPKKEEITLFFIVGNDDINRHCANLFKFVLNLFALSKITRKDGINRLCKQQKAFFFVFFGTFFCFLFSQKRNNRKYIKKILNTIDSNNTFYVLKTLSNKNHRC